MTVDEARALVAQVLCEIVPDAEPEALPPEADIRQALELDSLDFVELVERLSSRIGARIEEDDYPRLRTMASAAEFLAGRASSGAA